jgi:drug/metabolite transporter (DMT)-like permease
MTDAPGSRTGALYALLAAALFGASAPLAKRLLPDVGPVLLAGLLYLGAGVGLSVYRLLRPRRSAEAALRRADLAPLAGVVALGGVAGPVLMLVGLGRLSGVAGALLLNLEGPLTAMVAVLLFREHLGRRAALATALVVAGAVVLGYRPGAIGGGAEGGSGLGALAIAGACLAWAIDNNLTQRLSLRDPVALVRIKTLGAGACNLTIGLLLGQHLPALRIAGAALAVGAASYGASVVLDVHALRRLGAAREAAFFATAPFVGALAAVPVLGESFGFVELAAGALMIAGVLVLLRERHSHVHTHAPIEHDHRHVHDEHHQHAHEGPVVEPHSHLHRHEPLTHEHPHTSDLHHRHRH